MIILLQCVSYKPSAQNLSYKHIEYGVEHGIPSSEVYNSIEDKDGFMWFATDGGVSKFDGYEFKNYSSADGLSDNVIFHIYQDEKDRIWFMGFNGSLSFLEKDSIYSYKYNNELKKAIGPKKWITRLKIDSEDNIEFTTINYGFGTITTNGHITYSKFNDSNYTTLILKDNSEKKAWAHVLRSNLIKSPDTLLFENNRSGKHFFFKKKIYTGIILHSNTQNISFSFGDSLFYVDKDSIFHKHHKPFILGVSTELNGHFWVREQNNGVNIYKNINTFFNNNEAQSHHIFKNINIAEVKTNKNGETWICMENNGICYIPNQYVEIYTNGGVQTNNKIVSLYRNEANEMFYANESGKIYKIDTLGNHSLFYSSNYDISKIHITRDKIYISVYGDQTIINFPLKKEKIILGRGFIFSKQNDLLTLGFGSLLKESNIILTNNPKNQNFNYFTSIFEDFNSNIWIGGREGLFEFRQDNVYNITDQLHNYKNVRINDIDQLSDSTLILATGGDGLLLVNNFNKKNNWKIKNIGLKGPMLRDIHIDDSGDIWVASTNGLFSIKIMNDESIKIQRITHQNGLPANEINEVSSIGDMMYVATNKGLAIFNKKKLKLNKIPPRLHIQSINVNEKEIELDSIFDFKFNENNIEFNFVGLSYRSLGKVKYHYKLEGIDEQWQQTMSKKIRYPYLAPKTYIFRLSAANEDGIWSGEKIITFTIHPPFWKSWWFILIAIIFIFSIAFFIFKQRHKRLTYNLNKNREIELQKRKVVETELKALRAQMNPHFTFNTLNSIQNSVMNFDQETALTYISNFSLLIRKVLENSKYSYITISEEIEMLKLYLKLENLRFDNSIHYDFIIDDKIDQEFQVIPSMIIQPFVENSILHGLSGLKDRTKAITIEMTLHSDHILCTIEDNGIGRVKSAEINKRKNFGHQSLGLEITRERLALLFEGKDNNLSFKVIDLSDENGEPNGTKVEVIFSII